MMMMLDTHTLLWMVDGSSQLSARAAREISDARNVKHVSKASLWEIAIKVSTGKLTLPKPLAELIAELRRTGAIQFLDLADAHLVKVSQLPFHHRDPFDRLLVAQALTEGMIVLGDDAAFDTYGVTRIW